MEYSYRVSIPLSANSNICVSFGLVLVDWSFSFWFMLSWLFTSLIISDWIPDTVNSTLLGDGIYLVLFVSSYKYSWALFTTAAKILRNSLILSGLLRFLRQDQRCSWSRVSNSPLQTQDPSVTLSNNAVNYEVFQFGCWEKALNPALCEPGDYCLHFLGIWFPGLGQSPYMNVLANNLLNTQKKNLCRSPELARSLHGSLPSSPLCTALSPPVLCLDLSQLSAALSSGLGASRLHLCSPSLCHSLEVLSEQRVGRSEGSPCRFSIPQVSHLQLPEAQYPENNHSIYFVQLYGCLAFLSRIHPYSSQWGFQFFFILYSFPIKLFPGIY